MKQLLEVKSLLPLFINLSKRHWGYKDITLDPILQCHLKGIEDLKASNI